LLKRGTLYQ